MHTYIQSYRYRVSQSCHCQATQPTKHPNQPTHQPNKIQPHPTSHVCRGSSCLRARVCVQHNQPTIAAFTRTRAHEQQQNANLAGAAPMPNALLSSALRTCALVPEQTLKIHIHTYTYTPTYVIDAGARFPCVRLACLATCAQNQSTSSSFNVAALRRCSGS